MAKREPARRDTKERILAAALGVFGERGYAASSVDDVAAAAGVTKGAVYYYFADKADLGADLQRQLWDELTAASLDAFDPDLPTVPNLCASFTGFVRRIQAMPAARGFLREAWFTPALDPSGRATQLEAHELVRSVLAQGIARGEVVDVDADALASVLLGVLMEATLHVMGTGDPDATLEIVDHLVSSLAPLGARTR